MKLTYSLTLNRAEVEAGMNLSKVIMETYMPDSGEFEDLLPKAITITEKIKFSVGNAFYACRLKDTLEVEQTVEINEEFLVEYSDKVCELIRESKPVVDALLVLFPKLKNLISFVEEASEVTSREYVTTED